jgi:hypothetical protein
MIECSSHQDCRTLLTCNNKSFNQGQAENECYLEKSTYLHCLIERWKNLENLDVLMAVVGTFITLYLHQESRNVSEKFTPLTHLKALQRPLEKTIAQSDRMKSTNLVV